MIEKSVKLYTFEELPKEVQDKLIKNEINEVNGISNNNYNILSNDIIKNWSVKLEELGFKDVKVRYSGFWCQGDGASFTSESIKLDKVVNIHILKENLKHIRLLKDGTILKVLKDLEISLKVRDHHYCHYNTVGCETSYYQTLNNNHPILFDRLTDWLFDYIENLQKDYAEEIYRELEKEYDYCHSEEFVKEILIESDNVLYFADGVIFNE